MAGAGDPTSEPKDPRGRSRGARSGSSDAGRVEGPRNRRRAGPAQCAWQSLLVRHTWTPQPGLLPRWEPRQGQGPLPMGPLCHVPGVLGRQGCETGDELVDRGWLGCRQDLRAGMSRGSRRVCGSGLQGEVWAEARVWASVVIGTVPTSPAGPSGEQVKPAAARGQPARRKERQGGEGPKSGVPGRGVFGRNVTAAV